MKASKLESFELFFPPNDSQSFRKQIEDQTKFDGIHNL